MPKQRKPTGTTHRAVVTSKSFEVHCLKFPETKEAVEEFIAEIYAECVKSLGIPVFVGSQNETDDLDFHATLDGKPGYLELTEVAPLGVGGYKSASASYDIVPFAGTIAAQIARKTAKYKGIRKNPIILLLYVTDWHFSLANQVVEHLQYMLHDCKHGFARIDLVEPRADKSGELTIIYPAERQDWSSYDPTSHETTGIVIVDVSKPLPRDQWPDR